MAPWVEDDPSATIVPSVPWLTALIRFGRDSGGAAGAPGQAGAACADASGDSQSASPNSAGNKFGGTAFMTVFNYMRARMSRRLTRQPSGFPPSSAARRLRAAAAY